MFNWIYSLFSYGKTHQEHVEAKAQFLHPKSQVFYITHSEAVTLLKNKAMDTLFHVKVIKRTDGTVREMLCVKTQGSVDYAKGLRYNPDEKELLCVYDVYKECFRLVNLYSILEIRMHDNVYVVV